MSETESLHMCSMSVAYLVTLNNHDFALPSLSHFHATHWGVANGNEFAMDDGRRVTCITDPFDLERQRPILVRKSYVELWKRLWASYLGRPMGVRRPTPCQGATIIDGHPGIGKNVALRYLMCASAEARIPFAYHRTGDETCFVCLDVGQFFVPISALSCVRFTARALILIDSKNGERPSFSAWENSSAHVVLSATHTLMDYRNIAERRYGMYYTVSLVPKTEFKDMLDLENISADAVCRTVSISDVGPKSDNVCSMEESMKQDMPDMADDDFTNRPVKHNDGKMYWHPMAVFSHLGPNLHVALKPVPWTSGNALELFPGYQWDGILDCAAAALKALPHRDDTNIELIAGTSLLHTFFFERPRDAGCPFSSYPPAFANFDVPTPFLRGLLIDGMRTMHIPERLDAIYAFQHGSHSWGSYLRGAVYEAAALSHMADAHVKAVFPASQSLIIGARSAGPSFVAYKDNNHWFPPAANRKRPAFDCDLYAKPVPYIPDQSGFYTCPPGFPGADAIILADDDAEVPERYEIIVRATAANNPKIDQRGVDIITQALDQHTPRKRTRLFLFVSDSVEKSKVLMDIKVAEWTVGSVTLTVDDLLRTT